MTQGVNSNASTPQLRLDDALAYVADYTGGLRILQSGLPAESITHVSGNTYRIDFGQTIPGGSYTLQLGPEILDMVDLAMDQDENGIPREGPEDMYIVQFDLIGYDFGDAPDPTYPTLLANDGAQHFATGPTLGAVRDAELDGQPTATADGDDLTGDDEDGLAADPFLILGNSGNISLDASGPSFLNAWIDFNANGVWEASEQIAIDTPMIAGVNQLLFDIPLDAVAGGAHARFRLTSYDTGGTLGVTGLADDGEVEDYRFTIYDEVHIDGTEGDDVIHIWPGTPGSINHRVSVNGVSIYYDSAVYAGIVIDGLGGTDTLSIYGKSTDETADFNGTSVHIYESSVYGVYGDGFENIYLYGGGGGDAATMLGTTGADNFYVNQSYSYLRGNSNAFFNYTKDFTTLTVDASGGGGTDRVYMYDSPGDDILVAGETQATIDYDSGVSPGVDVTAIGFDETSTYAVNGGTDVARLTGSDGDDRYTARDLYGRIAGNGGA